MATLDIEWRHLVAGGATCERCEDTGAALRATLETLATELAGQGVAVRFREVALDAGDLAESNLILLNGRPLEDWLRARTTTTACASCGDLVGAPACCRAVEVDGILHEAIPAELIRAAALAASLATGLTELAKENPMKTIKVLGSGCRNCETTAQLIAEVAAARGAEIQLEKVTDMAAILGYGIMTTPGVVVDGKVVHAGGVPDRKKIEGWLAPATGGCCGGCC